MDFINPFVLPTEQYTRDIFPLKHYVDAAAAYLSMNTGDDIATCRAFVLNTVKNKNSGFCVQDPKVTYLEREQNGDRVSKETTLSSYLLTSINRKELIAPTLTTYMPVSEKVSILGEYVEGNIAVRDKAKKAMFEAKMVGDKFMETLKNIEQKNTKIANNSLSGAHASSSTPLFNKTAHSTLTSTCRSTSGYGNANNEKLLTGNRHYWSADTVRNNIISIITHTDYNRLERVMAIYSLKIPTVQETYDCITYSTDLYWRIKSELASLKGLVEKMTDIQRAAFVYTGDLYHLAKFNPDIVRTLIGELLTKVETPHSNPDAIFKLLNDDYRSLVLQLCANETRGKKFVDIKNAYVKDGDPSYAIIAATGEHVLLTLDKYFDFIQTFFVTNNVPASMSHFPDSIRRSALTSDTDSTIFTVQDWIGWYCGEICCTPQADAVAATMIFLASQTITHILAIMSANFGVEQSRLYQILMKNEFKFDVFVPTQVAKHYYATISCQEGNVFAERDTEIKGVHLKSSNAPKHIMARAKSMMEEIMATVVEGKKIKIMNYLKEIADLERTIITAVESGSSQFFRVSQTKPAESYRAKELAPAYQQYEMWNAVFGPKYGFAEPPPFNAIKVSTELDKPANLNEWIARMEDREMANRMQKWLAETGKRTLGTLNLPHSIIKSKGMPKELLAVVGTRKIVLDCTRVYYIILETLGVYMLNKRSTKLVSDMY